MLLLYCTLLYYIGSPMDSMRSPLGFCTASPWISPLDSAGLPPWILQGFPPRIVFLAMLADFGGHGRVKANSRG